MAKTAAAKVVNYTPEMTLAIVEAWKAAPTKETVVALATKFGKTTRSIIAKLSREKVYVKAEYVGKNGEKPETKEAMVESIAKAMGVPAEKLSGLEAATKVALVLIRNAVMAKVSAEAETAKAETVEAETVEAETVEAETVEAETVEA